MTIEFVRTAFTSMFQIADGTLDTCEWDGSGLGY